MTAAAAPRALLARKSHRQSRGVLAPGLDPFPCNNLFACLIVAKAVYHSHLCLESSDRKAHLSGRSAASVLVELIDDWEPPSTRWIDAGGHEPPAGDTTHWWVPCPVRANHLACRPDRSMATEFQHGIDGETGKRARLRP